MNTRTRSFLFCPGPVNTASNVKRIATLHEIGHREKEFELLFQSVQNKILDVFEVKNKSAFVPVILTGSGSAANEAVLSSIVGDKKILIISNGEFGERLLAIAKLYSNKVFHLQHNWGDRIDLNKLHSFLSTQPIDIIAMVHHETSSGMINPINEVGLLTKKLGITFFVDSVSGAGAEKIDLEKWNIAYCTTTASKALASLSGLSVVVGRINDLEKLADIPPRTMYLNLYKFYEYSKNHQTPNTPATSLFFALEQALDNILKKGVTEFRSELQQRSDLIRNGLQELGFSFLINNNYMSKTLTTVNIPPHLSVDELRDSLRKRNIIIYDGKGPFKGRVFQVANIGEISESHIDYFLKTMSIIIKKSVTNSYYYKDQTERLHNNLKNPILPQFIKSLSLLPLLSTFIFHKLRS